LAVLFRGSSRAGPLGFAATRFGELFGWPILIRCADSSDTALALLFVKMGFLIIHGFRTKVCEISGLGLGKAAVFPGVWFGFEMGS